MAWPSTRFEALYAAHVKRKAIEQLERSKYALVSGVWANTNLDDEKAGENRRQSFLDEIEQSFDNAINIVYTGSDIEEESEIDWSDPFFAAMKVPGALEEESRATEAPVPDRTTTTDLAEADVDQA